MYKFIKTTVQLWSLLTVLLFHSICYSRDYQAPHAVKAPVINGVGNDSCWKAATWYPIDQTWEGKSVPVPSDFSGRFKLSWDKNKLYILGEITNDSLHDGHKDPLDNYYNDDAFEILLDENSSGGEHQKNYNAFAYHISTLLDVVDIDTDGNPKLFNNHISVKWTRTGNIYTWECAVTIYTDKFVYGATGNALAVLEAGKKMGFAMAYCDNDGGAERDNFMGSEEVKGSDKNVAYKDASIFGTVTLVEKVAVSGVSLSQIPIATGLNNPTVIVCAEDGRIFVCEQEGNLRVIKNGVLLPSPALSVKTSLVGSYSERGLIGLAIDPQFASNNYIYIYYTATDSILHNRVSRFTMSGNVAVPGSEVVLLNLDPLGSSTSHNGGAMAFGKDGKLYIATGDNQLPDEPRVSQNLATTHGKLLRINRDGTVPADNPFVGGSGRSNLVWAYGLRNPFTFDIQQGTGRIWVNDVGEEAWEEIDDASKPGLNFGWPGAEGISSNPSFTNAIYVYNNTLNLSDTIGCAITGGVFFNPSATSYPAIYMGKYFFMDFCNNWINYIDPATGKRNVFLNKTFDGPIGIDVGVDGNLYYLSRGSSSVVKVTTSSSPIPDVVDQPDSIVVFASQPATFKVAVTGQGPIQYQWKKNGVNISDATSSTYTINETVLADSGFYSVVISNTLGSAVSKKAFLKVGPKNTRPAATILTPAAGTFYTGSQTIVLSGLGKDLEEGNLPQEAYAWYVDFHHDRHVHNGVPVVGKSSMSFTFPSNGETSSNVFYRFTLIVKDHSGLSDTAFVEVHPRKSTINISTYPAGLKINLDGQPRTTPVSDISVQGVIRSIGPVVYENINGKSYVFDHWSQNGDTNQVIPTPAYDVFYKAIYRVIKRDTNYFDAFQDAYVQDGTLNKDNAASPFGSLNSTELVCKKYAAGPNRNIYISFDLKELNDSIKSARLQLYGAIENIASDTTKMIQVVAQAGEMGMWNENTITWNNKAAGPLTPVDTVEISGHDYKYYYWDVSSLIRQQKAAGKSIITFVLTSVQNSFPKVNFNSKENPEGKKPQLIIVPHYQVTAISGSIKNNAAVIKWTIVPEEKLAKVILQRSGIADSIAFTDVASFDNNAASYIYTDSTLKAGTYFYRVKIVNTTGSQTFSEKVYIESGVNAVLESEFSNDRFYVTLREKFGQELHWHFYNLLGQQSHILQNPDPSKIADQLLPGVYFFMVYRKEALVYNGKLLITK